MELTTKLKKIGVIRFRINSISKFGLLNWKTKLGLKIRATWNKESSGIRPDKINNVNPEQYSFDT